MRFLVCTVGGSPAPVIATIKKFAAAFVFFIGSKGDDPSKASAATVRGKGGIAEKAGLQERAFEVVEVEPDSLESVYEGCERTLAAIKTKSGDTQPDIIADYTGGTKTMSAGLVLFALHQQPPWQLFLQSTTRNDLIKITTGNVVWRQATSGIVIRKAIEKARELAAMYNYAGARAILENAIAQYETAGSGQEEIRALINEYRMWEAWNGFNHAQARDIALTDQGLQTTYGETLRKLSNAVCAFTGDAPLPRKNIGIYCLVNDLLRNVDVCATTCRYDDAAGRLYRATELLAQIHLRRCYGINTAKVDLASPGIPAESHQWLSQYRKENGTIAIGLFPAYRLLADMNDPLGKYAEKRTNDLKKCIERRNTSIFAHGLTPITEEQWHSFGEQWKAWITGALEVAKRVV